MRRPSAVGKCDEGNSRALRWSHWLRQTGQEDLRAEVTSKEEERLKGSQSREEQGRARGGRMLSVDKGEHEQRPQKGSSSEHQSNRKATEVFPGGAVVENPPANAGDTGSSPGLGRSHMPRSNWARAPQLLSLSVWSLCSATREAAIVRGPRTVMKSGPACCN